MKILLLALLLVCYTSGRPQDPVTREFGTQPNNPNVKIFSTYPTLKPVTRQDNPNDLKKIDNEKLEKDEKENTELKGEELVKADNDETDSKANNTKMPDDETDAETPSPITEETEMKSEGTVQVMNETEPMVNASSQIADEQALNESSADTTIPEEVPFMSEAALPSEIATSDAMVTADPNPPIIDIPIIPFSEPEYLSPIGIETPLDIFPLTNEELEDEYFLNIPEIEDEEPIFGFGDQTPFISSGVLLPVLIPGEEIPYVDYQNEDVNVFSEITTLSPIVEEQSLDENETISMTPADQGNSIKPEMEMTGELLQPMASLTDQSSILDPVVETNEPLSLSEGDASITLEEETTESNIDMIPMEGEIGASMPMSENIPPVVEVEPDVIIEPDVIMEDTHPENMTDELIATEIPDMPKEKYSLKIAKAEATGEDVVTEYPTEKPIQMAGFMSEELKSSSEPSVAETTIPSTTELIFVLNFTDIKEGSKPEPEPEPEPLAEGEHTKPEPEPEPEPLAEGEHTKPEPEPEPEPLAEGEHTKTEPIEPMDNLDNLESYTEKPVPSTTENLPIVNPDELTNDDDVNNDLTQNETI